MVKMSYVFESIKKSEPMPVGDARAPRQFRWRLNGVVAAVARYLDGCRAGRPRWRRRRLEENQVAVRGEVGVSKRVSFENFLSAKLYNVFCNIFS